jgi:hypothetical protein
LLETSGGGCRDDASDFDLGNYQNPGVSLQDCTIIGTPIDA